MRLCAAAGVPPATGTSAAFYEAPSARSRVGLGERTHTATGSGPAGPGAPAFGGEQMTWTKPEIEVVEVTMEVTAYVARR
jgi:coenzyme PQQ precursor peptide PqqA